MEEYFYDEEYDYFDSTIAELKEQLKKEVKQEFEQKVIDKIKQNNNIMLETKNKYSSTYTALDEWRNAKAQNEVLEEMLEEK